MQKTGNFYFALTIVDFDLQNISIFGIIDLMDFNISLSLVQPVVLQSSSSQVSGVSLNSSGWRDPELELLKKIFLRTLNRDRIDFKTEKLVLTQRQWSNLRNFYNESIPKLNDICRPESPFLERTAPALQVCYERYIDESLCSQAAPEHSLAIQKTKPKKRSISVKSTKEESKKIKISSPNSEVVSLLKLHWTLQELKLLKKAICHSLGRQINFSEEFVEIPFGSWKDITINYNELILAHNTSKEASFPERTSKQLTECFRNTITKKKDSISPEDLNEIARAILEIYGKRQKYSWTMICSTLQKKYKIPCTQNQIKNLVFNEKRKKLKSPDCKDISVEDVIRGIFLRYHKEMSEELKEDLRQFSLHQKTEIGKDTDEDTDEDLDGKAPSAAFFPTHQRKSPEIHESKKIKISSPNSEIASLPRLYWSSQELKLLKKAIRRSLARQINFSEEFVEIPFGSWKDITINYNESILAQNTSEEASFPERTSKQLAECFRNTITKKKDSISPEDLNEIARAILEIYGKKQKYSWAMICSTLQKKYKIPYTQNQIKNLINKERPSVDKDLSVEDVIRRIFLRYHEEMSEELKEDLRQFSLRQGDEIDKKTDADTDEDLDGEAPSAAFSSVEQPKQREKHKSEIKRQDEMIARKVLSEVLPCQEENTNSEMSEDLNAQALSAAFHPPQQQRLSCFSDDFPDDRFDAQIPVFSEDLFRRIVNEPDENDLP